MEDLILCSMTGIAGTYNALSHIFTSCLLRISQPCWEGFQGIGTSEFFQGEQNVIACSGNVAVQLFKENATNLTNTGHCSDLFSFQSFQNIPLILVLQKYDIICSEDRQIFEQQTALMMMGMMITNCNNVNLTDNVPNNFSSIVHSPGFICAPHSCNKARQISFICLLFVFVYHLFICAPHSCNETCWICSLISKHFSQNIFLFFRRSRFQTFIIENGVYLLVDWFYDGTQQITWVSTNTFITALSYFQYL